jgi:phosphoribosylamine--glycine ligase
VKILVLGTGGREHALVRALLRDPAHHEVHAAPGNAGIAADVPVHPVDALDAAAVADLAVELTADLVVIGPEAPLVIGVADAVRDAGIACFGPTREAARLEGSKAFANEVMAAAGVPTSRSFVAVDQGEVAAALDILGPPYVVKDDGLAAGKGVVVTTDRAAALAHAATCERVVVEEYLDGPEVSLFVICDLTTAVPLVPAQDFKRAFDGDAGPNTGGMGAYTPLPWAPAGLTDEVMRTVVEPTLDRMRELGTPFTGVLYVGLALTAAGPRVVEFNARFGDPETEVVLELLASPLGALLAAAATGTLAAHPPLEWNPGAAVTVVVASEGYPDSPRSGRPIRGLAEAGALPHVTVLHAGTKQGSDGEILSAGGRVLAVTATGADLAEARTRAYAGVALIDLDGAHARTDIALVASTPVPQAAATAGTLGP